jgi:type VI secretion system protein ImpH
MDDTAHQELFRHPQRFEFSQAMRVLLRNSGHGNQGEAGRRRFDWRGEPVRIKAHQSFAFPTADIQSLQPGEGDERATMGINFLGLTGPSGLLPQHYTQFLRDLSDGDTAPADFLDLFNHRMAMLFHFAWEKYRFAAQYEGHPETDVLRWILLSLIGLASEHLQDRQAVPDDFFVKYAALLALQPRPASALRSILADHFGVPVEIDQFAGGWFHLDEPTQSGFREEPTGSERLGYGVVLSSEYWSQESVVRVRIGPMSLDTYTKFLPDGHWHRQLAAICRFYSGDELAFDVQLILDRHEVPRTELKQLAREGDAGERPRLGWTTWMKQAPLAHDAGDVVLRLGRFE